MTSQSLRRIEASFVLLAPKMEQMTRSFYDRLFAARPDVRALFKVDMAEQRQHFAAALAIVSRNLRMLDLMTGPLHELGAGHAEAGVRPSHYPSVRDAMLAAIGEALGSGWTADLVDDWRALLDLVCGIMLEGASQHASRPRP
jgi:hemoglobin-like flavoprotein